MAEKCGRAQIWNAGFWPSIAEENSKEVFFTEKCRHQIWKTELLLKTGFFLRFPSPLTSFFLLRSPLNVLRNGVLKPVPC